MLIERPPILYRLLFPGAVWRIRPEQRAVYLTFDDGPVPEVTPWVLDVLDQYGAKATFFMVGDNAVRHPELVAEVLRRGHALGNHTMHHTQGLKVGKSRYMADVAEADLVLGSTLFRPPHGFMGWGQRHALQDMGYQIVMQDVVTRDYDASLSPIDIVWNVANYVRQGSIIVFHDSLKAWKNVSQALSPALHWLVQEGYAMDQPLPFAWKRPKNQ